MDMQMVSASKAILLASGSNFTFGELPKTEHLMEVL